MVLCCKAQKQRGSVLLWQKAAEKRKFMKKLWACLLAVLVLFSVAACGDGAEQQSPAPPAAGSSAGQETVPAATDPAQDGDTVLGTLEGNTYKNTYAGLTCTLPDTFSYGTAEELLVKNGLDAQAQISELTAMVTNHQPVYVMYAQDPQTRENINISIQQAAPEELAQMDIGADFQAQIPGEISSYEAMGLTNVQCEYKQLTVSGKLLDALALTGDYSGQKIASVTVGYKTGDCLVLLTLAGADIQSLEQLLSGMTLNG